MTFQITADKLPDKFRSFLIPQDWDEEPTFKTLDFPQNSPDPIVGEKYIFQPCTEMADLQSLRKAEKIDKLIQSYGLADYLEAPRQQLLLLSDHAYLVTPIQGIEKPSANIDARALAGIARLTFDVELSSLPEHFKQRTSDEKIIINATYPADRAAKKWWKSTPLALLHDSQISKTTRGLIATTLFKKEREEISGIERVEGQKVLVCALLTILKLALIAGICFFFWGTVVIPSLFIFKALWIIGQTGMMFFVWLSNNPEKAAWIREQEQTLVDM